jgi:hypothetical protein
VPNDELHEDAQDDVADTVRIGRTVALLRGPTTQQEIAAEMRALGHAKWSQATVWAVESGTRPLRLTEAVDLAGLLEVRPEDLLRGVEDASLTAALSALRVARMRYREAQVVAQVRGIELDEAKEVVDKLKREAASSHGDPEEEGN